MFDDARGPAHAQRLRGPARRGRRGAPLLRAAVEELPGRQARGRRARSTTRPGSPPASSASGAVRRSTRLFADIDVILTAPAPGEAPLGLERTGNATFNLLWTYLWMPCVTLPFTRGPDRAAGRHPARRPPARGRRPARHRRLGEGSAAMKPLSATEAVAGHRGGHAHLREAGAAPASTASPSATGGEGLGPSRSGACARAGQRGRRNQGRRAARRADRREGHHRHARHADRPQLADLRGQGDRSATPPAWRSAGRPMPSSWARR